MKVTLLLILGMLLVMCAPAFADPLADLNEAADSDQYGKKAPAMFVRGGGDVLISPAEVITTTYQDTIHKPPVVGTVMGLGKGTAYTIDRAGRGTLDMLTFWVPNYNGQHTSREIGGKL